MKEGQGTRGTTGHHISCLLFTPQLALFSQTHTGPNHGFQDPEGPETDARRLSHRKHACRKPHKAGNTPLQEQCAQGIHTHSQFGVWQRKQIIKSTDEKKKKKEIKKKPACIFKESSWKMKTHNNKIDFFFLTKF